MTDKPMTMKSIRAYLAKQGMYCDRNWMTEYVTVYSRATGEQVAQGPRSEIVERLKNGEQF